MFLFYLLFCVFVSFSLSALYNGNPSSPLLPEKNFFFPDFLPISLKLGFQYNEVFNRKLKRANCFHISDKLGMITFDIIDRVEVYAAIGFTKMNWKDKSPTQEPVRFSTSNRFAWGIGGRVLFSSWGRLDLGFDAEAYFVQPHSIMEKIPFAQLLISQSTVSSFHYNEWQVGGGISYRSSFLIPYVGIKYARAHATVGSLQNLKSKEIPGLVLGLALTPPLVFDINVEARFFDETAVTSAIEMKF